MKRKVILDVEPGITDVLTLYMALFEPELDVLGITVCGGENSMPAALRCVQRILDALEPPKIPRLGVGMGYLPMPMGDLEAFHSSAFFSAMELSDADYVSVHPACRIITELVLENPREITLLSLGPLTNSARVLTSRRDLAPLFHRVIMVGGSVLAPGNASAVAEYNMYRDPFAAEQVFRTPIPKTLIPLDVTSRVVLDYDILHFLPSDETPTGKFLRSTVCRLLQLHREWMGIEGIFAFGMVGLLALLHPEFFSGKMMYGEVESEGEKTCGMTVFERRFNASPTPNVEVMTGINAPAVEKKIYDFLKDLKSGRKAPPVDEKPLIF